MHEREALWELLSVNLALGVGLVAIVLFFVGVLPIPIGYERGKVRWLMWCGTGMHAHVVYWHGSDDGRTDQAGFQAMHPADPGEEPDDD